MKRPTLWIVLILMAGVLPLKNFVSHAHWEYIKWAPTAEDIRSPKYILDIFIDLVGNTARFFLVAFSEPSVHVFNTSRQWLLAAGIGGALSPGIEFYQVYCHSRFPSIFDIIANVTGRLMGVHFPLFRKTALAARQNQNITPNPQDRSHTL
ncbi:MAG: VanZ family protein [Nitrospiraceae bacterium]